MYTPVSFDDILTKENKKVSQLFSDTNRDLFDSIQAWFTKYNGNKSLVVEAHDNLKKVIYPINSERILERNPNAEDKYSWRKNIKGVSDWFGSLRRRNLSMLGPQALFNNLDEVYCKLVKNPKKKEIVEGYIKMRDKVIGEWLDVNLNKSRENEEKLCGFDTNIVLDIDVPNLLLKKFELSEKSKDSTVFIPVESKPLHITHVECHSGFVVHEYGHLYSEFYMNLSFMNRKKCVYGFSINHNSDMFEIDTPLDMVNKNEARSDSFYSGGHNDRYSCNTTENYYILEDFKPLFTQPVMDYIEQVSVKIGNCYKELHKFKESLVERMIMTGKF